MGGRWGGGEPRATLTEAQEKRRSPQRDCEESQRGRGHLGNTGKKVLPGGGSGQQDETCAGYRMGGQSAGRRLRRVGSLRLGWEHFTEWARKPHCGGLKEKGVLGIEEEGEQRSHKTALRHFAIM